MILTVFFITLTLIFPLFLNIDIIYTKENKKFFFCFYLFGVLKILSGYVEPLNDCVAVHVSKNKAFLFYYKNILNLNKSMKPLKDYHFLKIKSLIEVGSEYSLAVPFFTSFIYNFFMSFVSWFFYNKKPYLDLKNDVNIYENKDILNIFINTKLVFNLLMIVLSIIKIITEKIINGISKRKQNKLGGWYSA